MFLLQHVWLIIADFSPHQSQIIQRPHLPPPTVPFDVGDLPYCSNTARVVTLACWAYLADFSLYRICITRPSHSPHQQFLINIKQLFEYSYTTGFAVYARRLTIMDVFPQATGMLGGLTGPHQQLVADGKPIFIWFLNMWHTPLVVHCAGQQVVR